MAEDTTLTRRSFIKKSILYGGAASAAASLGAFSFFDTYDLRVTKITIPVNDLPENFIGYTIAQMTDFHCRDQIRFDYLKKAVLTAAAAKPNLFVLTGDYVSHERKDIPRIMELFGPLQAEHGKLAVLGNHDHWTGAALTRKHLAAAGAEDLTNANKIIARGNDSVCIAGVGDLWEDAQDLGAAYGGVPETTPRILLSHNPDYAETMPEGHRTDIMLSGHTHGGQVVVPYLGAPVVPSNFGQKFASGLVTGKRCRVYVSRGVGFIFKFRWNCPPEISLITLTRA